MSFVFAPNSPRLLLVLTLSAAIAASLCSNGLIPAFELTRSVRSTSLPCSATLTCCYSYLFLSPKSSAHASPWALTYLGLS